MHQAHLHHRAVDSTGKFAITNSTHLNATADDAAAMVRKAHEVMRVINKERLDNPKLNKNVMNPNPGEHVDPAPPLPYQEGANFTTLRRRQLSNGTSESLAYTIPPELAEAARIVAESTPQIPKGDHAQKAAEIRRKYARKTQDTIMPPQALVNPNGLVEFVSPNLPAITDNSTLPKLQPRQSSQGFWMADIAKRGASPYGPTGYKVWRNVRDYGARGDGKTDDTAAINKAISDGGRCGVNCGSSTITPAVVYFPPGTYLVSSSIIQYYNTQFLGNPFDVPTILAASSFVGLGVITSNQYMGGEDEWYLNTNNFLRSIRNFKIDLRNTDQKAQICGIHWQVAQASSLENIEFYMLYNKDYPQNTQQGIFMENGSGGFLADLTFIGGKFGAYFGNQQFTTHQLIFWLVETACQVHWDWAWTMQDVTIETCQQGLKIVGGAATGPGSTGQAVGSFLLVDAEINNTPKGIVTTLYSENSTSLLIQNVKFNNVDIAVSEEAQGRVLLAGQKGGTVNKDNWGFGRVTDGTASTTTFSNGGDVQVMNRTAALLADGAGHYKKNFFTRRRPKYDSVGQSQIMDVKTYGAKGDGVTDDVAALNSLLATAANMSAIVYFPFGVYIVKDTLKVPVGSRIIGQAWSQIMATGSKFEDATRPRVAVQVGCEGDVGVVEIQDMMFTVSGPTAGAVLVEWNVYQSSQGSAGMWDTHFRVGGAIGSKLQKADCPKNSGTVNSKCIGASLLMNLTPKSSAYLENIWAWVADHDLDVKTQDQIDIYVGRGILVQSQLAWLYGTSSEHSVMYQYQLSGASNVLMGMIQTESPYFQPVPKAPVPFTPGYFPNDPDFKTCSALVATQCNMAYALRVIDSTTIYGLGSGLYSFFSAYSQDCLKTESCQLRGVHVEESYDVWIYNLCTKAMMEMISPYKGVATKATDNKNGFLSSVLAWLRGAKQTIGLREFHGFPVWTLSQLDKVVFSNLTTNCKAALTQPIKCDPYVKKFQELAWRRSLNNKTLTDSVCDPTCGSSLRVYFDSVSNSCAGQTFSDTVPTLLGGRMWAGYNETCFKDFSTQKYCNDLISNFTSVTTKEQMPQSEACSYCYIERYTMMQRSPYSSYDADLKSDLDYLAKFCGKTLNTTIPSPLVLQKPVIAKPCLTKNYTTVASDTCETIALANNVSSAAIYRGNQASISSCFNITAGTSLCLPVRCARVYKYNNESCYKIETRPEFISTPGMVRRYNPWVDYDCLNLNAVGSVYGRVLCMGPHTGIKNATVANGTDNTIPSMRTGYAINAVAVPFNATVARNTTLNCGEWHIANMTASSTTRSDTCTGMCLQHDIPIDLFLLVNPSLPASNCTGNLKDKLAYCVGPTYLWNSTLPAE